MQSGLLLVDKPEGPTSAHVVARVKGILGAKKVGHLGTLDPFASGLLPLGINDGTKIADIFLSAQKSYRGVIALGVETDTQDSTGKVIETLEVPGLSGADLEKLRRAFTGSLMQTPPMYSALKRAGVRLYHLARKGQTVARSPREIKVKALRLWKLDSQELGFEVTCSKGTYIRTLASDMGKHLGCGAHLKSLRRLSCGNLSVDRAIALEEIEKMKRQDGFPLLSINEALNHLGAARLEERMLRQLRSGQQEALAALAAPKEGEKLIRLLDAEGELVALARWTEEGASARWRLYRVFAA